MSFNLEEGIPIAVVKGGPADGQFVFLQPEDNTGKKMFTLNSGEFRQLANSKNRIHYAAGPAGVGKSTKTARLCQEYQLDFPDNPIFMLSRLDEDPAFDGIKLNRIVISDDLVKVPIQIESVGSDCLVVFDDLDTIYETALLKSVYSTMRQCMELGRHKRIQMIITSHLINGTDVKLSRTIQNELDTLTIFPQGCNIYQVNMNLQNYWALTPKQIRKIMAQESRWVTLYKKYPQMMLTEKKICLLKDL